jgi:hypothetical protein
VIFQMTISSRITSTTGSTASEKDTNQIAAKETRDVFKLRVSVVLVLLVCAISVSIAIYKLTQASEQEAFQIQYKASSDKIMKAFQDIFEVQAGALASLAVAMTTHGICQFQCSKICSGMLTMYKLDRHLILLPYI